MMSILITILLIFIYFGNKNFFSYWSNRGIPYKEPTFLIGELGRLILKRPCFGDYFNEIYRNFKNSKIVGLYFSFKPALVINDPLLIQDVLIKNFTSFHNRGFYIDEKIDPLQNHLFTACSQEWRDLRTKLSPTFTSGKLKGMFTVIHDCAQVLQDHIEQNMKNGSDAFDIRDLLARYTTSVISSVAFGIENDCINEPDNLFRKMGAKFWEPNLKQMLSDIVTLLMPKLHLILKLKITPNDVEEFFMSVVQQTIKFREENKDFNRKDFMQLMIQLKNQGYLSADRNDEDFNENDGKELELHKLTFNEVAAQAFMFFLAGFETSSSTLNFCLYELTKNPQIQLKVQQEIDRVLKSSNSKSISYDLLHEMKYLECCINETLRKYPILPMLTRECNKQYTFQDTKWTIEEGTQIFIPIMGLHRDPDIYDNPMEFRPERFIDSPTGNGNSKGLFYMPFGDGPRNCIGARMGMLQTKLGLAMILSKFSFEFSDQKFMQQEMEFCLGQFLLTPKEDFMLKFKLRQLS